MDLYNLVVSAKLQKGGGGGDVDVDPVTITENGVYSASSGHAYSPVTVSVPQSGITPTGTKDINANGIYDVTAFASASVAVPTGVFPSGTSQITSNGIYDIETYKSASVNVPGIVPSGTSSITSNGIYDITSFASVDVNVSGGGGGEWTSTAKGLIEDTLTSIEIPNDVHTIKANCFNGSEELKSVIIRNASTIEARAFVNVLNLETVDIGEAITYIGDYNFYNLAKIKSVICRNINPPSLGTSVFYGMVGTIYVPAESLNAYKSANRWSSYASKIQAIPTE